MANAGDDTVSVIDGATCNSTEITGCKLRPVTVKVGAFGDDIGVDPVTNMVFVTNQDAEPGTVSVIDGNSCNGMHPAGCKRQPFTTVKVGGGPSGIGVNSLTDTVYVANTAEDSDNHPVSHGDTLSVIDGATCGPSTESGCAAIGTVRVGADPANVAIDPATNTVYVANTYDNTNAINGTVSVVDGAVCDSRVRTGCASERPPQVPVSQDPASAVFDIATGIVWVTNHNARSVSLINAIQCTGTRTGACKVHTASIPVGSGPSWVVINSNLDTVYTVDGGDNAVLLIRSR